MEVERMRSQEFMALGSALVVIGIVFGEDRLIGYSFIFAGVLLSIISTAISRRKTREANRTGGM
jgi:hypothetical protein